MKEQIEGLAILPKEVILQDQKSSALFGFINARRRGRKLLVWETVGFMVCYNRVTKAKFSLTETSG